MKNLRTENTSLLAESALQHLAQGVFEDVFSVLGLHRIESEEGWVVRAFLPGAHSVSAVHPETGRVIAKLDCVHESGIFERKIRRYKKHFRYKLLVQYESSSECIEDPYTFPSQLVGDELYLFGEGNAEQCYRWMGATPRSIDGVDGTLFVVWAPAASRVSVVGDFNYWDGRRHRMRKHPANGIWELFIPGLAVGCSYKYEIADQSGAVLPLRADPYARRMQHPPQTASCVTGQLSYEWGDQEWMKNRVDWQRVDKPMSVYEVHAGSWRRKDEGGRYLSYLEFADELIAYVLEMGFTHIQFMPLSEFPFDGSWGYQPVGLFAPSIRFGTAEELCELIDRCHQNNIGVLLDWVPGHFPTDEHGLGRFDGTCLYEHEDKRQGYHPDWNTLIYNYGRGEVVSFLLSNALYWLEEFHFDGLRVDAVASMLYLDYSREEGEWIPNQYGGRENLEAIELLKKVNQRVAQRGDGALVIAEESTAWPGVTRPVEQGGLGFGYKWNMGWMNDSLKYIERDPIHRQYHHDDMTFSLVYAFDESFVLPLSHDEVVHGKGSLINKMPGDDWQRFANLRAYYGFTWAHPGKKLLFMGGEFAQSAEWNHDQSLDWHLLEHEQHRGIQSLVADLNRVYRELPALHQRDCRGDGFEWVQVNRREQSIFAWLRLGEDGSAVLVVCNLTPSTHHGYRVGVPVAGHWSERVNTDAQIYGGGNQGNQGGVTAQADPWDDRPHSLEITVPALSTLIFVSE